MSSSRPPRSVPATTLGLGIVTALVVLHLLIVSGGDAPPLMWLFAVIYAAYAAAAILVAGAAVARLRGRPLRPIPLLPERWRTSPRAYTILAAVVLGLTLIREGAFAPWLVWNYDVYHATHHTNTSRNSSSDSITTGDGPADVMAGRLVECSLECTNPGPTCEAVLEAIRCDGQGAPFEDLVMASGSIDLDHDPGCYFPLYKESQTAYSAHLMLSLDTASTSKNVSLDMSGTLSQDVTGPMSCHSYRRLAAQKITGAIANALQDTLQSN